MIQFKREIYSTTPLQGEMIFQSLLGHYGLIKCVCAYVCGCVCCVSVNMITKQEQNVPEKVWARGTGKLSGDL